MVGVKDFYTFTNHRLLVLNLNFDIKSNEFLDLINSRDEKAFDILYSFYQSKLLIFAKSYIGNHEDAEEIIDDVFCKIWNGNVTTAIKNINSYLYTATRNSCIDYLKKKKSEMRGSQLFRQQMQINYNAIKDESASKLIEEELEKQIDLAVQLLPERCRLVFKKSRFQGLKNKEISEELNISVKAVEKHMTKALRHMKYHLQTFLHTFL